MSDVDDKVSAEEDNKVSAVASGSKHNRESDDESERPTKYQVIEHGPDTNTTVVASHYNTLEEKGLHERSKSRIFYMRNFNNWIKSMLINEYLGKVREKCALGDPLRVLDIGCGKGGDLLKWQKGNITHLICTDIADVSMEQCEARYKNIIAKSGHNKFNKMFTAEFITSDSTLNRLREKYRDPSIQLNLVSCQFAFHYCFESLKQAECMLKNAAECLKPGGYFIGTIPDADEIMKRQQIANDDNFGNDVYRITFLCDTEQPPLFGAKYNFHLDGVVDCPEFLVHFGTLVKLAKKFGLELVAKERFEDLFERKIPSGRGLIEKMQALETYPGMNRFDLVTDNIDEYEHAKNYLAKQNAPRFKKVGTLTKSEWEASCKFFLRIYSQ
jgi:mRNA (guanine-N7-)-methyltransferase